MKKATKLLLATAIMTMGFSGAAFANGKPAENKVSLHSNVTINCDLSRTDICIINAGYYPIQVTISVLNQYGYTIGPKQNPTSPSPWADFHSTAYYSAPFVQIYNSAGQRIYANNVNNHNIVRCGPQACGIL